ncbi:MAG TPA: hypothetical protein VFV43_12335 [Limnobacter sp.]|nr:hypothetical protein [Limnobacter sp.]
MSFGHSVLWLPMPAFKFCIKYGFCAAATAILLLGNVAHGKTFIGYTGKTWSNDYGVLRGQCDAQAVHAETLASGMVTGMAKVEITPTFQALFAAPSDSSLANQIDSYCFGHTLELVPSGQAVRWRNPANGIGVYLSPGAKTDTCRSYLGVIFNNGEKRKFRGEACAQQAGQWRIED